MYCQSFVIHHSTHFSLELFILLTHSDISIVLVQTLLKQFILYCSLSVWTAQAVRNKKTSEICEWDLCDINDVFVFQSFLFIFHLCGNVSDNLGNISTLPKASSNGMKYQLMIYLLWNDKLVEGLRLVNKSQT